MHCMEPLEDWIRPRFVMVMSSDFAGLAGWAGSAPGLDVLTHVRPKVATEDESDGAFRTWMVSIVDCFEDFFAQSWWHQETGDWSRSIVPEAVDLPESGVSIFGSHRRGIEV
jgi:hypothetical protein